MKWLRILCIFVFAFVPVLKTAATCTEQEQGSSDQAKTLEDIVSAVQRNACQFPGIEKTIKEKGLEEARVLVQLGFIDQVEKKSPISLDSKIAEAIESYLQEACGFRRDQKHELSKSYPSGFVLRINIALSSSEGSYDPKVSAEAVQSLASRVAQNHYFVYIGHSRHGKGMDFYPWTPLRGKKIIPVYTADVFSSLFSNLTGVAIIGCDSSSYSQKEGAAMAAFSHKVKLYTQDQQVFNLQNSLTELLAALAEF